MKKSIFIAAFIFILVVGWIGSGQFTNVNAQDDTSENSQSTVEATETVTVEDNGNKVEIQELDRKSTRLNSSHSQQSRMPSSA